MICISWFLKVEWLMNLNYIRMRLKTETYFAYLSKFQRDLFLFSEKIALVSNAASFRCVFM